ncbi:MAG: cupin domain-containing protein [Gammaproteobacteria bacterium]
MSTKPPIINIADLEYVEQKHGKSFAARFGFVAQRIGAQKLGYRVVVVPPKKRAWPYHAHSVNEEMFFILEGEGMLRHAGQEYPLRSGDFIASPADPNSPHQIINTSNRELKYLAVSTMLEPEVSIYPDSGKFGVFAGSAPGGAKEKRTFSIISRKKYEVDYWDGEDGG